MLVYLDSSLVLTRYLDQPHARDAEAVWRGGDNLVASVLMVIETVVALRRSAATADMEQKTKWLLATLSRVEADFQSVSILYDMKPLVALICQEERLSSCRASDALHVASALWLHRETGRPIFFGSLDRRQRELAAAFGLSLLPESL